MELAVYLVQRTRQRLVGDRCLGLFAAHNTFDPNVLHQPCDGTAGDIKAFPAHLMPHFANTIDAEVFLKDRGGPGFSTSFMPRSALAWFSYHAASFVFGFRLA
jgi:hypothetical protein